MAKNITKKQAGVIYRNWKLGNLTATKETMNKVYDYAEYYVSTDSKAEDELSALRACIDAIFANDMAEAQSQLDRFVSLRNLHYAA